MTNLLNSFMDDRKAMIEKRMTQLIDRLLMPNGLKEAMLYSLEAGGKRLRPILAIAAAEAFGENAERVLDTACAIELVHTYSLIHDDLPCMDDDDYRRGKLTSHKVFGEALAVLAGDALLTHSFFCISSDSYLTDSEKVEVIRLLSESAGPAGMVGGQTEDMEGEKITLSLEQLESIHEKKTGKMLECAVIAGGIVGGASSEELEYLKKYASHIGIAFQIQDDILDVTGDEKQLGKPVGSDLANHKSTYPKLLQMEGAISELSRHIQEAKTQLLHVKADTVYLEAIADYIIYRNH